MRASATDSTATTKDWAHACALAHARLCAGTHGAEVEVGESWLGAIGRVAGRLLQENGYTRPRRVPDEWPEILRAIAAERSTAGDGLVRRAGARVKLGTFPRWAT